MKAVDTALAETKPMLALSEREKLVRAFPDFKNVKRVKESLQKALDLERSIVATDETERTAEVMDEPRWTPEPILGVLHSRSRMDELSQGKIVFVTAKDSCYAIDPATGELVWRRVIGFRTPFFPVLSVGSQSVVLLFDTRTNSLLACQMSTGRLIWKQMLNARAIGKPLINEGQIYLSLVGNTLVRIDLETGRLSATVRFSQNLATPPVLSRDGKSSACSRRDRHDLLAHRANHHFQTRVVGRRDDIHRSFRRFTDRSASDAGRPSVDL